MTTGSQLAKGNLHILKTAQMLCVLCFGEVTPSKICQLVCKDLVFNENQRENSPLNHTVKLFVINTLSMLLSTQSDVFV